MADEVSPSVEALVTQDVPPMRVRVNADTTISDAGVAYSDGDEIELPGPVAQNFAAQGYVTLLMEDE